MIRVAAAVTHHPKRADLLDYTLRSLAAFEWVHVETDKNSDGCWATRKRCWEWFPAEATHLLVVDDDLRFCRFFCEGVTRAARYRPNDVLSFYANRPQTKDWRPGDPTWVRISYTQGPAVMMSRRNVDRFLRWEEACGIKTQADDELLRRFCRESGLEQWTCMPSLVQHGSPNDSLVLNRPGDRTAKRTASYFIGERKSALTVDFRARHGL